MSEAVFIRDGERGTYVKGWVEWKDPLRGGSWFAAPGVRYVAVKGAPEGQRHSRCACEDAVRLAAWAHNTGRESVPSWANNGWSRCATAGWVLIRLHDLGPERVVVDAFHVNIPAKATTVTGGSFPLASAGTTNVIIGDTYGDDSPRQRARRIAALDADIKAGRLIVGDRAADEERAREAIRAIKPRYVVLEAGEMEGMEGRLCLPYDASWSRRAIEQDAVPFVAAGDDVLWQRWGTSEVWLGKSAVRAIVDTQDGWTQQPTAEECIARGAVVGPNTTCTWTFNIEWEERGKPQGPSDAEIVAAYELVQRSDRWPVTDGGRPHGLHVRRNDGACFYVNVDEVRAAWSRELQRRCKAIEEAKRLPCETYDEGVDVGATMAELCDPFARVWNG